LDEIGIGGERVRMYNLSSAQAQRFAEICEEMTERVRALGPNPLKGADAPDERAGAGAEAEVRA